MDIHDKRIGQSLTHMGISKLNTMQQDVIEAFDKCGDMVILSPTGSGKTLAFLLPLLSILDTDETRVQVLILSPARELAIQIEEVFKSMKTSYKVNCCYGGHQFSIERNNLSVPPAILVGTPGRVLDHLQKETFDPSAIHTIIYDEFDKSLEYGFAGEMEKIAERLSGLKKRLFTSATQALEIPEYTGAQSPKVLNYIQDKTEESRLKLFVVNSEDTEKLDVFIQLICDLEDLTSAIVFCNHRETVDRVSQHLSDYRIENEAFHGGLDQRQRELVLNKFKNGSSQILVTTDLAARGLDITDVQYVIHYQIPHKEDAFTHRNGRTARITKTGSAYLFITSKDKQPEYLPENTESYYPPEITVLPAPPKWISLCIKRGKKDKINKIDIVGFLSKVGGLNQSEIGMITVQDFVSYVAVDRTKADSLIKLIRDKKIKNKVAKISLL